MQKYLICKIPALHSQIGADMLVDRPCKFIVELPSDNHHQDRAHGNDARNDNQKRLRFPPHVYRDGAFGHKHFDGVLDLLDLHRSVNQKTEVAHAQTDDLNGILEA